MNKKWAAAAVLALTGTGASAADDDGLKGLFGFGLTYGDEKLATVTLENSDKSDIRSGGLVTFFAGGEYRFGAVFSLQSTIGWHIDSAAGDNGSLSFSRYPVELLAHFRVTPTVRLGGGVRKALNPKVSGEGIAAGNTTSFESSTGGVVEIEYLASRLAGVKLRYVTEKYKPKNGTGPKADGNHIGLIGVFYF
jgi:outer membrane protein with beta-barrel domain